MGQWAAANSFETEFGPGSPVSAGFKVARRDPMVPADSDPLTVWPEGPHGKNPL